MATAYGPPEANQLMSAPVPLGDTGTRYQFVQAYVDRLGQVLDRAHLLPISPFFTREGWERLTDSKQQMSERARAEETSRSDPGTLSAGIPRRSKVARGPY